MGEFIDLSRLESAESEESVRNETRRLLQEAQGLVETAKGTEQEEDFKREYNELNEKFEEVVADWVIDSEDLSTLRYEVEEVRAWREIDGIERTIISYIEGINQEIIEGDETKLEENLDWYLKVFSGDTGWDLKAKAAHSLATSGSNALSDQQMSSYAQRVEDLKNSNGSKYTKLFQLSQIIHDSSKEAGFWGGVMESAHHHSTREIIKKVIENSDTTFAIWKDTEKWYFTTKTPNLESDLEVGTYLCSLNKNNNLTRNSLEELFGKEELFWVLKKYKDGNFGDMQIRGLFIWYLWDFDTRMKNILAEVITSQPDGAGISSVVESWIQTDPDTTKEVVVRCDLCSKIDTFSYQDIRDMSPQERALYEETQPEFYEWLMKKLELHEESIDNIRAELTTIVQEAIWENQQMPDWLQDRINTTAQNTFEFMEVYFQTNARSICSIDLKELFLENDHSPLKNLSQYIKNTYGEEIDIYSLIDSSVVEGFWNQRYQISQNINIAKSHIEWLRSIPENERTQEVQQEITTLENDIIEWEEELDQISQAHINARALEAQEIAELSVAQVQRLKTYIRDNNLSPQEAHEAVVGDTFDFSNEHIVDMFLEDENKYLIRSIRNTKNLVEFLEAAKEKNKKINISHIHPLLRWDFDVLRAVSDLNVNDIVLIPETYFDVPQGDTWKARASMFVLLNNSRNAEKLIIQKFEVQNPGSRDIVWSILDILKDSPLSEHQKNNIIEYLNSSPILTWTPPEDIGNIPGLTIVDYESTFKSSTEIFQAKYSNMVQHNSQPQEWDEEFFQEYFSTYWINDVKDQFKNLCVNPSISFNTISSALPYINRSTTNDTIVVNGIKKHGLKFVALLSEDFRSAPEIIKVAVEAAINPPSEWVDRALLMAMKKYNLEDVSNIVQINDARSLIAAYQGIWNNIHTFKRYFWNKFDKAQIDIIMNNAEEEFKNQGEQEYIQIIEEILSGIKEQQETEEEKIWALAWVQESFQWASWEEKREYIDSAKLLIAEAVADPEMRAKLERSIQSFLYVRNSNSTNELLAAINEVFPDEWDERATKLLSDLVELRDEVIKTEQSEVAARSLEEGSAYPTALRSEIIWENGEPLINMRIEERYNIYLMEHPRGDTPWEEYRNWFLTALYQKYNITDDHTEAKGLIDNTYLLLCQKIDNDTLAGNPSSALAAARNGWEDGLKEFLDSGHNQYANTANTRVTSLQNKIAEAQTQSNDSPIEESSEIFIDEHTKTQLKNSGFTPEEISDISQEDTRIITSSPEALQNFIDVHSAFKRVGFNKLWQIKDTIFKAVENVQWISFNIDSDYINGNELKILFNTILISIWEDPIPSAVWTIEGFITEMEKRNGTTESWDEVQVNHFWETRIEEKFLNKFFPKSSTMFLYDDFEQALKSSK